MNERGGERREFSDFCSSIIFTFTHKHGTPNVLRKAINTHHAGFMASFGDQRMVARVMDHSVAVAEKFHIHSDVNCNDEDGRR